MNTSFVIRKLLNGGVFILAFFSLGELPVFHCYVFCSQDHTEVSVFCPV